MIANGTGDFLEHLTLAEATSFPKVIQLPEGMSLPKEMPFPEWMYVVQNTKDGNLIFVPCSFTIPKQGEHAIPIVDERANTVSCGFIISMPHVEVENAVTLAEYAERWLNNMRHRVKESSYNKYWNLLHSYIIPELGGLQWQDMKRETVESFCGRMLSGGEKSGGGLTSKTVGDIMSVLRQVFRYAVEHGAEVSFDISSITIKKEQKEIEVLTRMEQDKLYRYLLTNISDRNLGLLVCIYAGLRLGEICALKWADISFSEQTIFVQRTMQRVQTKDVPGKKTKIIITPPKSGNSVRRIPIPRELARILFSYSENRSGYILTGKENKFVEPRTMERHFEKVLKEAGIRHVNFHTLRHTFATRCIEMDFDVKCLSEILGHSNVNITLNRYVHPTMELKRSNMEKFSVMLAAG